MFLCIILHIKDRCLQGSVNPSGLEGNTNNFQQKNKMASSDGGDSTQGSSGHSNSASTSMTNSTCPSSHIAHCIQLAACGPSEILPMHPDLPADVFTACLTTPIHMAVRWHILQNKGKHIPGLTLDIANKLVEICVN